jgi:5-(carboxyamino)imidazole ribonucleotide mutase
MVRVYVVMGSDSDLKIMSSCLEALEKFQITYEVFISSAHRLPDETARLAREAAPKGVKVIIAGAGAAAHLAGVIAAWTTLPVIAVPLSGSPLGGLDALYATVQMPKGIPVATVAVDGAFNAGVLAAQILALQDVELGSKLARYKEELALQVTEKNQRLQELGYRGYLGQ